MIPTLKKYANMFGIPVRTAIHIKLRQITQRMDDEDSLEYAMALCDLGDCLDELMFMEKRESFVVSDKYRDRVTDEMIEQAKAHPMSQLLALNNRNQCLAWCHADKRPSLHYNPTKNRCFCNVCGKVFNSIDVVMYHNDIPFLEAVRYLCQL